MRCVVLVCLPAVPCLPCLPCLVGLPVCCVLACLLACVLGWTRHILERAFDQGSAWIDQEADCWLAISRTATCAVRLHHIVITAPCHWGY